MKLAVTRFALLSFATILITSCDKKNVTPDPEPENPTAPSYVIPTTYNFANADLRVSNQRLLMLSELTTYIRSTHTTTQSSQPVLDAQKLKNMFANNGSPFADVALNNSGISLKEKTSNTFAFYSALETNFDDAAAASLLASANPTSNTATDGTKGKLISPARAILVDAKGVEYKEFAEKGLMSAMLYSEATKLLSAIGSFDNSTAEAGITAQEKAWDEAFGYFGVPLSFPTSTVGLKNWGSYCNSVNSAINCNATIMNAFLKGRAAISNKDYSARDEARDVVIATWEKVAAAKCINYLKGAKNNFADKATLHHNLSEGYGFIDGFKYNSAKKISNAEINELLNYIGSNFYNVTQSGLDNAINKLASIYTLDATKL